MATSSKPFDYSKLSPAQNEIALKVIEAAKKYGINPEFVLPLAMAESGLSHIPSRSLDKNGEPISFGVMQLTPALATDYGIKDYKKASINENIDVGMHFLSDLSKNKNIGNDPKKMIAGYNAGPGTAYVKSGKDEDLLPETKAHVDNIRDIFSQGGTLAMPINNASSTTSSGSTTSNGFNSKEEEEEYNKLMGITKSDTPEATAAKEKKEEEEHKEVMGVGYGTNEIPTLPNRTASPSSYAAGAVAGSFLSGAANAAGLLNELRKPAAAPVVDPLSPEGRAQAVAENTGVDVVDPVIVENQAKTIVEADKTPGEKNVEKTGDAKGKGPKEQAIFDRWIYLQKQREAAQAEAIKQAAIKNENLREKQVLENKAMANENYRKSILGRTSSTLGNTLRGGLSGAGAYYGTVSASDALANNEYAQALLHGLSATGSLVDLGASALPYAKATATRAIAAPLALGADVAANVYKHGKSGQYSEIPVDVGVGALGLIPYAGIPLSMSASYLRDHPEVYAEWLKNNSQGYQPSVNMDAMGNPY